MGGLPVISGGIALTLVAFGTFLYRRKTFRLRLYTRAASTAGQTSLSKPLQDLHLPHIAIGTPCFDAASQ